MDRPNKRLTNANGIGPLAKLLSSRSRAELFRLLFGLNRAELYVRELERLSGLNVACIHQELRNLSELGLVVQRTSGNRKYYRAATAHPLFQELHRLVLKTDGLVDVLRGRLEDASIAVAFVFGSVARGTAGAESDVDLFIVGELGLREATELLHGVSDLVFREVNPYVVSASEFAQRLKAKDHFVSSVVAGEKLFVVGDDERLGAMGR
jgi:predicted nucleotidyltransferase